MKPKNLFIFLTFGVILSILFLGCQKTENPISETESLISTLNKAAAQTAQSAQINMPLEAASFEIVGTEEWGFDWQTNPTINDAEIFGSYFTITITGAPGDAAIQNAKRKSFTNNKCNFWAGSALVAYFDSKTSGLATGQYSILCTPEYPGQYDAKTGWSVVSVLTPATINLTDMFVASQSFVMNSDKKSGWTNKYSFTLVNRVEDLKVELIDANDNVVAFVIPEFTYEIGSDWPYYGNAGTFGNSAVFGRLKSDMVSVILLSDDFAGNNGVGGERAMIEDVLFEVTEAGNYSVRVSGKLKGNGADLSSGSFSVTSMVTTTGGCN